jgi:hypothetical protein
VYRASITVLKLLKHDLNVVIHVKFVVDQVDLNRFFFRIVWFSTVSIIPSIFYTHLYEGQAGEAWEPPGNREHLVAIFKCLLQIEPVRLFAV